MAKLLTALLVTALLAMQLAAGLGVTPSRVILRYEPGGEYIGGVCFKTYGITNLQIEKGGDFSEGIELIGVDAMGMLDAAANPCIEYKITLPRNVDKPGMHYAHINALEVPDQAQGNIFAVVKIQHQIWIEVPYPGKYLEITSFDAPNSKAGAVVPFTITVQNKGVEPISGATGTITVFDKDNRPLATMPTTSASALAPAESRTMTASWNSSGSVQGNYRAEATISYDNLRNNESKPFKLGGLDVSVVDYTKEVYIGGIRPFVITVDNIWSEPVNGVKALVEIFNNTRRVTAFETLTRTLPPWSTETLPGFIDTELLGTGDFDLTINLTFENMSKSYDGRLSVLERPAVEEPSAPLLSTRTLLMGMIILLVIVAIILLFALLPRKKKEEALNKEKPGKHPDERAG